MYRRSLLAIVAALTIGLLPLAPASGVTATVSVSNYDFAPDSPAINRGDSVEWAWEQGTHRLRDDNIELRVIRSPLLTGGGDVAPTHTELFWAAGTYPYHCTEHPEQMEGRIRVRLTARYRDDVMIAVRWATQAPPTGYVYDVQYLPPGETMWSMWKHGVISTSAAYDTPPESFSPKFRSRLRRQGYAPSLWSPAATAPVST